MRGSRPVEVDPADLQVGQRIKTLREEQGLTLEKLAYEADLDKGNLSRIERGHVSPQLNTLRRIAARLGVPVSRLVADESGRGEME